MEYRLPCVVNNVFYFKNVLDDTELLVRELRMYGDNEFYFHVYQSTSNSIVITTIYDQDENVIMDTQEGHFSWKDLENELNISINNKMFGDEQILLKMTNPYYHTYKTD